MAASKHGDATVRCFEWHRGFDETTAADTPSVVREMAGLGDG
jgi:hypothetical protein